MLNLNKRIVRFLLSYSYPKRTLNSDGPFNLGFVLLRHVFSVLWTVYLYCPRLSFLWGRRSVESNRYYRTVLTLVFRPRPCLCRRQVYGLKEVLSRRRLSGSPFPCHRIQSLLKRGRHKKVEKSVSQKKNNKSTSPRCPILLLFNCICISTLFILKFFCPCPLTWT